MKEAGQVALCAGEQVTQFGGGYLDYRAVVMLGVHGQSDDGAATFSEGRGVVTEGGPAVAVEDLEPVAPLVQPVAAARHQRGAGCGVRDAQAARRKGPLDGEQAVQEAL
ncbi:hypothetical protein WDH52_22800 [Streptomyces sp. TRM70308]|uniref:hypothetical protein n=1 Tax=Streptomyces sp. TRM70308 TaxID=3131932 RepID=UPI003CFFFF36